ncbi:hypothetical protein AB4Y40_34180 [Paraburkholderia sp. EG287B]
MRRELIDHLLMTRRDSIYRRL